MKSNVGAVLSGRAAIVLLAALGVLFCSTPFLQRTRLGGPIEAALLGLVMLFAILAVGVRGRSLWIALALVVPALAAKLFGAMYPGSLSPLFYLVPATLFFVYVVAHILKFVLHASTVDANVLCAGLSGYVLLGLLWVPIYALAAEVDPSAFAISAPPGARFDGMRAFYFSFVTLCTVGYGDIVPASPVTQMLAIIEAIAGLFYVAVLISRLVAIYSSAQPIGDRGRPE